VVSDFANAGDCDRGSRNPDRHRYQFDEPQYPTDLALVGDVREALRIWPRRSIRPYERSPSAARRRSGEVRAFTTTRFNRLAAAVKANLGKPVIHADELICDGESSGPNSIIVSENLTASAIPSSWIPATTR